MELKRFATLLFFTIGFSYSLYCQVSDFSNTDFGKADSVAMLYADYPLNDLKGLAEKLTSSFSTEEEKFRAIYFWVCNTIEGDYPYYLKNERQRTKFKHQPEALKEWNDEFSKQVFARLLNQKKTVCTGYAYLVKTLSTWAGLSCQIVDGYGRSVSSNVGGEGTPNHSWNAIRLYRKWYVCDATWSSGVVDPMTGIFIKQFDEAYFLASPSLFIQNHFPLDTGWILIPDKPFLTDFLNGPIVYKSVFNYEVKSVSPSTFNVFTTRGQTMAFQFQKDNGQPIKNVTLQINGRTVFGNTDISPDGLYSVHYLFKNKGKYVVHVLLESNYAFTYLVEVSRV